MLHKCIVTKANLSISALTIRIRNVSVTAALILLHEFRVTKITKANRYRIAGVVV